LKQPELPPAATEEIAEIEADGPKLELPEEPIIELPAVPEEKQRIAHMKKRIVEKITAEPAASSRLVQAWLREED
jgi:hypothetical protein